jgi:Protein of unknown function (DUF3987)
VTSQPSDGLPLSVYLRPELGEDALLGLPGEIAVRLAEATGADPAAVLLSVLTMIGNAAGPEPHVVFGGAEHSARLFVVIFGDAALGRKGTAVNAARRLFREADPLWEGTRIRSGVKSPEAMISLVDDNRADDCRLLLLEPEFGRLAASMARTEFSPRLRAAWDGEPLDNNVRDPKRALRATHAHISMVAMITPAELERHHKRLSQAGGLESRLLLCCSAPSADVDPFGAESTDYSDLIDRLWMTLEASRSGVLDRTDPISRAIFLERGTGWQPSTVLPMHDKVVERWRTLVRDRLPRAESEDVAALWARAEVQVVRLAAAYAIGCGSDVVAPEHVRAAVAAWQFCAESAETFLGIAAGQGDGRADRVQVRKALAFLHKRQGGWSSQTEINKQVFNGNTKGADITAVLGYLVNMHHIESRTVGTSGRTRTEYRLIPRTHGKTEKAPDLHIS